MFKTVFIEDASSVSHNPANLVAAEPGAFVSATFVMADTEFTSPLRSADTRENFTVLPNVYGCWSVTEDVAAGIGITTPYGQAAEWYRNQMDSYFAEMVMVSISPSVAAKVCDGLSVGAGVDLYMSDLELSSVVRAGMVPLGTIST